MTHKSKNIPISIGQAIKNYFVGVGDFWKSYFLKYKEGFTSKEAFLNFAAHNWQKYLLLVLYILVSIALFLYNSIYYALEMNKVGYPPVWIFFARGFGMLLNFNGMLILIPVLRTILTLLRNLKFGLVLPFDENIKFHRYIAYALVISAVLHGIAHQFNYACCAYMYFPKVSNPYYGTIMAEVARRNTSGQLLTLPSALWVNITTSDNRTLEMLISTESMVPDLQTPSYKAAFAQKYSITGYLLWLVMIPLYAAANKTYRRSKNFTVFWLTHHLFMPFFVLLLIHGRSFWLWFLGPGTLYILERFLRIFRGKSRTKLVKVEILPSNTLCLYVSQPSFNYDAGSYCFVNIPSLSQHEWHPFTISSAPHEPYVSFHIKVLGDWTRELMQIFSSQFSAEQKALLKKGCTVEIENPLSENGEEISVRIDGPFGTCAEEIHHFEHAMLICTGVGVTPYSSLIKDIQYKTSLKKTLKLKTASFYWINRDETTWSWFSTLLSNLEQENPYLFDIHTFYTGDISAEKAKQIISASSEYMDRNSTVTLQGVKAKALFSYKATCEEEINIQEDDILSVEKKFESGWFYGTNSRTNEVGLYPGNYVSILDQITSLSSTKNRKYGRPVWEHEFERICKNIELSHSSNEKKKTSPIQVGIFVCGPTALSTEVKKNCTLANQKYETVKFIFHKENF